jgi:hypothetical protein
MIKRADKDIKRVLQRNLFTLTAGDEKIRQGFRYLQSLVTFAMSNDRNCKTLEIFLPDRNPDFLSL